MPDAAALREALACGCLVLGRLRKERLLLIAREGGFNTRIHLDRVQGLGDFMELEVVLEGEQSDAEGVAVSEQLMRDLGPTSAPRLAGAYLDLLPAAG